MGIVMGGLAGGGRVEELKGGVFSEGENKFILLKLFQFKVEDSGLSGVNIFPPRTKGRWRESGV